MRNLLAGLYYLNSFSYFWNQVAQYQDSTGSSSNGKDTLPEDPKAVGSIQNGWPRLQICEMV